MAKAAEQSPTTRTEFGADVPRPCTFLRAHNSFREQLAMPATGRLSDAASLELRSLHTGGEASGREDGVHLNLATSPGD